jgi:hypothetical protein
MQPGKGIIPIVFILSVACASAATAAPQNLTPTQSDTAEPLSTELPAPTASIPAPEPATLTPSAAPQIVQVIDDFEEDETAWAVCVEPECTDSTAVDAALTPDHATHGIQALQLNFEKSDKPKAVFYIERPMDLSGGRRVSFDIFNPGTIDGVGFALTTGPDSVWHESDMVPVAPGKKVTLTFDLTAGNYKTAATNWEFRASIADLDDVVRLSIVVYPKEAGSVIVDYLVLTD